MSYSKIVLCILGLIVWGCGRPASQLTAADVPESAAVFSGPFHETEENYRVEVHYEGTAPAKVTAWLKDCCKEEKVMVTQKSSNDYDLHFELPAFNDYQVILKTEFANGSQDETWNFSHQ